MCLLDMAGPKRRGGSGEPIDRARGHLAHVAGLAPLCPGSEVHQQTKPSESVVKANSPSDLSQPILNKTNGHKRLPRSERPRESAPHRRSLITPNACQNEFLPMQYQSLHR